jgi:SAM-dependent methyltransferase
MSEAKHEWNNRCKEHPYRYILGREVDEVEFDKSGELETFELLSDLPPTLNEWVVCDIGCGVGRLEKFLSDKFMEVHGVDVSEEMVRKGKDRLRSYSNVFLQQSNGKDLSMFSNCVFDLVFSVGVFQHVPRNIVFNNYFKEVYRVLKPRGYFKFTVPSRQILFSRPKHLLKTLIYGYLREKRRFVLSAPEGEPLDKDYFSTRFFDKRELKKYLRQNGFDVSVTHRKVLIDDGQFWVTSRRSATT